MLKAYSYYAFHSLINQIRKLLKTWFAIFIICCMCFGLVLGFVFSKIDEEVSTKQSLENTVDVQDSISFEGLLNEYHVEKTEFIEIMCGVVILGIMFGTILNSNKSGGAGFIPADANILFVSPMSPQNVLLFRLFCQLGLMAFLTIYYLIEIPVLMEFGLNLPSAITVIFSLGLACIFLTLLNTLIYLLTSGKEKYRKIINFLPVIVVGIVFIIVLIYSSLTGIEFIQSTANVLTSKVTRFIPIIGWIKALPFIVLEGNYLVAVLVFVVCIISIVILLKIIMNIKCDYYEDAIEKTKKALEKDEQAKQNGLLTIKSKKNKKDKKENCNLHFKGKCEYMFFSKQMYLRKKYARFGVFTTSSYVFLTAGLLATFIFLKLGVEKNNIPIFVGFIYGVMTFYATLKNPLLIDINTAYFRLAVGNGWKKVFWSLLAGGVTCFLNMLPGIVACDIVGIVLGGDVISIISSSLAVALFIISLDFYSSNVGAFIRLSLPDNSGAPVKEIVHILFMYFGLIPDLVVVVFCYNSLSPIMLMLVGTLINMLIGFFFMSFLPLLLWPSSKEPVKREKLVGEENLKIESKTFSIIGLGLAIALVVTCLMQILVAAIVTIINPLLLDSELVNWLVTFVPMYLIGNLSAYLIIRKIPIKRIEKRKLSFRFLIEAGVVLFSLGYIANIANRLLLFIFQVLGDFSIGNVVESLVLNKTDWILILIVIIVGPFFEELLFRKIIIDRLNVYGGKLAVIVSAIMFGLFHGNVEQILYAMSIGLILGYVYQRSGKLLYSWILHMIFNLNGSLISIKIIESNNEILMIVYDLILLAIILVGIVIVAVKARELIYLEPDKQFLKKDLFKTVFVNPGMILMCIACLLLVVFNLMNMIV